MHYTKLSTLCLKKTIHLTFHHNFGKCRSISKIFLHCQVPEKTLYWYIIKTKDSPPYLTYVSIQPRETWKLQLLPISMAYCMWDLRICIARYEVALIPHIWFLCL